MSSWVSSQRAYNEVNADTHNRASFSNDKIIGAASFGAFKMFEDAQRREGQSISHHFAKGFLVGLVSEEVERLFYEKRMNMGNVEMVQNAARKNIEAMYDQRYWEMDRYDPNNAPPMPAAGRDFGEDFVPQSSSGPRYAQSRVGETYGTAGMTGGRRQAWNGTRETYTTSGMDGNGPRQAWNGDRETYRTPEMSGSGRQAWNGTRETYKAPSMAGSITGSRTGAGPAYAWN